MTRITALILALCLTLSLLCACQSAPQPDDSVQETRPYDIRDDEYNVYYEIFVGSFCDSDGDGMGDLRGIIEKINYLNDGDPASTDSLHIGGIWLMPVMPSPTYHKYDVTDYYAIDEAYGTLEDFQQLAALCAKRDIDLIIDMPVNHSSNKHPWFISAAASIELEPCGLEVCPYEELCREHNIYCQFYNFSQTYAQGYKPLPQHDGWYYEAQFDAPMPDLNLDSEAVREEIVNICKYWLDMGIAGFRLDTVTNYYTNSINDSADFLGWFYDQLKAYKEDVYLVGEVWKSDIEIKTYYEASGIPSLFNFPFSSTGTIMSAVRNGSGSVLAERLITWDEVVRGYGCIDAPFLSNHDQTRIASALPGAEAKKQAAAVYLLMPGNPFIYYGEEIAMSGGSDSDPHKRAPMVWSLTDDFGACNPPAGTMKVREVDAGVEESLADDNSLLRFYIDTIAIRNRWAGIARGVAGASAYTEAVGSKAFCAYTLTFESTTLTVMHNLGEEALAVALAAGDTVVESLAAGGTAPTVTDGVLTLPHYSTVILLSEGEA